ncbi:MAG: archease [Deltaproteobacteria bacterium]|nr:MAG: archease [Deltaproteobacteria bacterium]
MPTYPQGTFRLMDHTADVGIQLTAETLNGLFEVAGLAFTEVITSARQIALRIQHQFQLQADEIDTLLVTWLQELLYLLDTEGLIFGRFKVDLQGFQLKAVAWGEPFDPRKHVTKTEIKAITYHQLQVAKADTGWQGQVILDI